MVKTLDGDGMLDHLESELGSLSISYLASLDKLNLLREIPAKMVIDGDWNKWDHKEVGGAALQFDTFLHESGILGLAKIVEDVVTILNKNTGAKLKLKGFWSDQVALKYKKEIRTILALNNIIKHQGSHLKRASNTRGDDNVDYVLDQWGIAEGWDVETVIHAKHDMIDIISHIPKIYIDLCNLIEKHSGAKSFLELDDWKTTGTKLFEYLVPETIGLLRPTFK